MRKTQELAQISPQILRKRLFSLCVELAGFGNEAVFAFVVGTVAFKLEGLA
jgi:hypothetical protein